jgi:hypothetical protein
MTIFYYMGIEHEVEWYNDCEYALGWMSRELAVGCVIDKGSAGKPDSF